LTNLYLLDYYYKGENMFTITIIGLAVLLFNAVFIIVLNYFKISGLELDIEQYKERIASLTADVELLCDERTTVIMEELSLPPERRRICHGCELIKNKYNPDNNIASIEILDDDTDELDFSNIKG
jgi:hypothetical protein